MGDQFNSIMTPFHQSNRVTNRVHLRGNLFVSPSPHGKLAWILCGCEMPNSKLQIYYIYEKYSDMAFLRHQLITIIKVGIRSLRNSY